MADISNLRSSLQVGPSMHQEEYHLHMTRSNCHMKGSGLILLKAREEQETSYSVQYEIIYILCTIYTYLTNTHLKCNYGRQCAYSNTYDILKRNHESIANALQMPISIHLTLSTASILAPLSSRRESTSRRPLPAVQCRGVDPKNY